MQLQLAQYEVCLWDIFQKDNLLILDVEFNRDLHDKNGFHEVIELAFNISSVQQNMILKRKADFVKPNKNQQIYRRDELHINNEDLVHQKHLEEILDEAKNIIGHYPTITIMIRSRKKFEVLSNQLDKLKLFVPFLHRPVFFDEIANDYLNFTKEREDFSQFSIVQLLSVQQKINLLQNQIPETPIEETLMMRNFIQQACSEFMQKFNASSAPQYFMNQYNPMLQFSHQQCVYRNQNQSMNYQMAIQQQQYQFQAIMVQNQMQQIQTGSINFNPQHLQSNQRIDFVYNQNKKFPRFSDKQQSKSSNKKYQGKNPTVKNDETKNQDHVQTDHKENIKIKQKAEHKQKENFHQTFQEPLQVPQQEAQQQSQQESQLEFQQETQQEFQQDGLQESKCESQQVPQQKSQQVHQQEFQKESFQESQQETIQFNKYTADCLSPNDTQTQKNSSNPSNKNDQEIEGKPKKYPVRSMVKIKNKLTDKVGKPLQFRSVSTDPKFKRKYKPKDEIIQEFQNEENDESLIKEDKKIKIRNQSSLPTNNQYKFDEYDNQESEKLNVLIRDNFIEKNDWRFDRTNHRDEIIRDQKDINMMNNIKIIHDFDFLLIMNFLPDDHYVMEIKVILINISEPFKKIKSLNILAKQQIKIPQQEYDYYRKNGVRLYGMNDAFFEIQRYIRNYEITFSRVGLVTFHRENFDQYFIKSCLKFGMKIPLFCQNRFIFTDIWQEATGRVYESFEKCLLMANIDRGIAQRTTQGSTNQLAQLVRYIITNTEFSWIREKTEDFLKIRHQYSDDSSHNNSRFKYRGSHGSYLNDYQNSYYEEFQDSYPEKQWTRHNNQDLKNHYSQQNFRNKYY